MCMRETLFWYSITRMLATLAPNIPTSIISHLSKNKKGKVFSNFNEIYNHFNKIINNNDLLMIKGSNATGMNQFSKNIKKGQFSVI